MSSHADGQKFQANPEASDIMPATLTDVRFARSAEGKVGDAALGKWVPSPFCMFISLLELPRKTGAPAGV